MFSSDLGLGQVVVAAGPGRLVRPQTPEKFLTS